MSYGGLPSALTGFAPSLIDLVRGGDQPDVAERLWEVPKQLAVRGVDFLGQQSEVVGVATSCSKSASARSTSPALTRQETSQNEQIANAPSSPVSPSAFSPSALR
jgi:hypothetical protein